MFVDFFEPFDEVRFLPFGCFWVCRSRVRERTQGPWERTLEPPPQDLGLAQTSGRSAPKLRAELQGAADSHPTPNAQKRDVLLNFFLTRGYDERKGFRSVAAAADSMLFLFFMEPSLFLKFGSRFRGCSCVLNSICEGRRTQID